MSRLWYWGVLLAQQSRLESLSSGFRRGRSFGSDDLLLAALILGGVVLAVWLMSYFVASQERRRGRSSPGRLFLSLCRAHRLRWSEWWLLWRVGRSQQLRDPACLFLEPERLAPSRLGPGLKRWERTIARLQQRLFAGLDEPAEAAVPPTETASTSAADAAQADTTPGPPPLPPLDVPPWNAARGTGAPSGSTD